MKSLQVGLQEAVAKEAGNQEAMNEMKKELAELKEDKKREEKEAALKKIRDDVEHMTQISKDCVGFSYTDRRWLTPDQRRYAALSAGVSVWTISTFGSGIWAQNGLWGLPCGLLAAGCLAAGEWLAARGPTLTPIRAYSYVAATSIVGSAWIHNGEFSVFTWKVALGAVTAAAVSAIAAVFPFKKFTVEVVEDVAEEGDEETDLPRDNRTDANNLLELTHHNPGFVNARFSATFFGMKLPYFGRTTQHVVSLERVVQALHPANQELDESDAAMWRRIKSACRTNHRTNDDRYKTLQDDPVSFDSAVFAYTMARHFLYKRRHFNFASGLIEADGPKEPHPV